MTAQQILDYSPVILAINISRMGGRTWPLRLEGAGPGEQGGTSNIRSCWSLETSFHDFIWMLCSFIMFLVFDTHATLSDGKRNNSNTLRS